MPIDTSAPAPMVPPAGERMVVLHFVHEYPPEAFGGVGSHVSELAAGLGLLGQQVYVLAPTSGAAATQTEGRVEINWIPLRAIQDHARLGSPAEEGGAGANFRSTMIERGRHLLRAIDSRSVLLHAHDWFTFQAAAALGAEFGHPVVATVHGIQENRLWWGEAPVPAIVAHEREMYARADGLIAVSGAIRELLETRYGAEPGRIRLIYNGMRLEPFLASNLDPAQRQRLRDRIAPEQRRLILFVGRVDLQKGIGPLLEAAALLLAERNDVRYVLAGETNSAAADVLVKDFFARHPALQPHIKQLGKIPRKQLALLYQIADIVIMPSLFEPCSYVALEAMAAGAPVIATAVGGFPELIAHEVTGLLVPAVMFETEPTLIDPAELAAAQQRLLQDRELAARLGAAGREHARASFTLEQMTRATLEFYQTVLRRCAQPAALGEVPL